jgi:hypothetical protein
MEKQTPAHHEMCLHGTGAICSAGDWSISQTIVDRKSARLEFVRHLHFVVDCYPLDGLTIPQPEVEEKGR